MVGAVPKRLWKRIWEQFQSRVCKQKTTTLLCPKSSGFHFCLFFSAPLANARWGRTVHPRTKTTVCTVIRNPWAPCWGRVICTTAMKHLVSHFSCQLFSFLLIASLIKSVAVALWTIEGHSQFPFAQGVRLYKKSSCLERSKVNCLQWKKNLGIFLVGCWGWRHWGVSKQGCQSARFFHCFGGKLYRRNFWQTLICC